MMMQTRWQESSNHINDNFTNDDENLMCECEGEGGDEKAKTEKDEGEESLAKLYWVLQWGLLMVDHGHDD